MKGLLSYFLVMPTGTMLSLYLPVKVVGLFFDNKPPATITEFLAMAVVFVFVGGVCLATTVACAWWLEDLR